MSMYIYIYMQTKTHIYMYMHTYVHTFIHACIHSLIQSLIHSFIHYNTYIHIFKISISHPHFSSTKFVISCLHFWHQAQGHGAQQALNGWWLRFDINPQALRGSHVEWRIKSYPSPPDLLLWFRLLFQQILPLTPPPRKKHMCHGQLDGACWRAKGKVLLKCGW